jgi:hypothetical protein
MAIPVVHTEEVQDRGGRPLRAGSKVRVAGQAAPVQVQVVDPRYGVLVVLVPGRGGQLMGQMVRAGEVEVAS